MSKAIPRQDQKIEDFIPELGQIKQNYQAMETALKAIKALQRGEWDSPELTSFGELYTSESDNIAMIIEKTEKTIT